MIHPAAPIPPPPGVNAWATPLIYHGACYWRERDNAAGHMNRWRVFTPAGVEIGAIFAVAIIVPSPITGEKHSEPRWALGPAGLYADEQPRLYADPAAALAALLARRAAAEREAARGSDLDESGTYEHWEPDDDDYDDPLPEGGEWEPACVNGEGCPHNLRCRYCVPPGEGGP